MTFLNKITSPLGSPIDAALAAAVTLTTLDGDLLDVEKRVISLFRDEFPPLGDLNEGGFQIAFDKAVTFVSQNMPAADLNRFSREMLAPVVTLPDQRLALYGYLYALAMADLNLDAQETAFLEMIRVAFNLFSVDVETVQNTVLANFRGLHQALAAAVLGLVIVSADGKVDDSEVQSVQRERALLEPIAALNDLQFGLTFDMALNIHDRFLLDATNRRAFMSDILAQIITQPTVRLQAFEYAAAVATSDADISSAEIEVMKELLQTLQISDAQGEQVFNKYMARVRTVDGKPR
ncbi:MAG TPA: TerB family tellurite resistance protein [Aggregatilineales bacterium]|nr:TerB family tellurite resistance protein [Anaerolineales bacterium]HRE48843.1 TerB family tellurite resistance protein [Aggregatilineales bacterium]